MRGYISHVLLPLPVLRGRAGVGALLDEHARSLIQKTTLTLTLSLSTWRGDQSEPRASEGGA
jgi:hypothetical protein